MDDLISRQAAIEVLRNRWLKTRNYEGIGEDIAEECEIYLKTLPSAQPEIIRCKDCAAYGEMLTGIDTRMICHKFALNFPRDFYCADAERRTDERTD